MTKIMFPENRKIIERDDEKKKRSVWEWIKHFIFEIGEIRTEIKEIKKSQETIETPKRTAAPSEEYYAFVNKLRVVMRADTDNGMYPEVRVDGMRIGVTSIGLLYEKAHGRILPRELAFGIYARLYDLHKKTPLFKLEKGKLCRTF